jgi:hypothetical protein
LAIFFSDDISPVTVRHLASDSDSRPAVQRVELGDVSAWRQGDRLKSDDARELNAYLRWQPGAVTVFSGTLSSDVPTSLMVGLINWFDGTRLRDTSIISRLRSWY